MPSMHLLDVLLISSLLLHLYYQPEVKHPMQIANNNMLAIHFVLNIE